MRFDLSDRTKWRLANKLTYNAFLRLLIFKFWFRMSFLAFVLTLLFLGLFLPRIWTASPQGQIPVIKISGLDKLQAWSLKRSARAEMETGRTDRAHYAWMGAIAHNPADPDSFRGMLSNLLSHPNVEPAAMRNCLGNALWLLHLTRTNNADLELAIALMDEYHYNDLVVSALASRTDHLTPRQESAYLKALFRLGRMTEFGQRWAKVQAARLTDSELPLYWAAYTVGWGEVANSAQARQKLATARADPALRVLANRLQLALSAKEGDLREYDATLKRLQEADRDLPQEHVGYWTLLEANGRKEEAQQLARQYGKNPNSMRQRIILMEAYDRLDLPELAQHCYDNIPTGAFALDELSMAYAQFLARHKRWEDLRGVAIQMRTREWATQDLVGYSYFLEGWAEHELERLAPAEEDFRKMNETWLRGNPELALSTGAALVKIGAPGPGRELLTRFEEELKGKLQYWQTLFDAANDLKDPALLLKAARKELEFQPEEVTTVNHYAAALLANRQEVEDAVKLTLRILNAFPNSADARINHSIALCLNHRASEARALLATIRLRPNRPEEATSFYMAKFLVFCELKESEEAWRMSDRIDSNYLFPAELAAVQDARQKLPPRAQAKLSL